MSLPTKAKVVVIGGGIHGLSTAWKLSETYKLKENLSVEELKTKLFKTSRPKSALIINEACEKNFFYLEKTAKDQRKKFIKPTPSFIKEFNNYLNTLKNLSF